MPEEGGSNSGSSGWFSRYALGLPLNHGVQAVEKLRPRVAAFVRLVFGGDWLELAPSSHH